MGVPTFYRWLCNRYPLIVKEIKDAVNEETCLDDLDLTEPNINGEFDCLYLDMNGIIHPCCNPSGAEKPKDEAEMFTRVCDYIDRLYAMVRPRRLLYMAIDGVAPRAKMNQQRSRRYKTALEMEYSKRAYEIAQEEFCQIGYKCPEYIEKWDSNVITPGTPFMERLTLCLHAYIRRKFETDESWKSISVIFSDSNIPGEGEHKILEYIRCQRSNPDYDPNTRHVLYGSDADLIMLGLSTHEAHFYIIREAVRDFKVESPSLISMVYNAWIEKIKSLAPDEQMQGGNQGDAFGFISEKGPNTGKKLRIYSWWSDIEIVDLSMLREYLSFDFNEIREQIRYLESIPDDGLNARKRLTYDFERCIDDFVFLCFFIGNDFLPNLPVFSIYKGSLDQILGIYIRVLPRIGEYLTLEGNIIPSSIIQFFSYLRDLEYEIIMQDSRFNYRNSRSKGKVASHVLTEERHSSTIEQDQSSFHTSVQVSSASHESAATHQDVSNGPKEVKPGRPTLSISEIELLFGEDRASGTEAKGSEDLSNKSFGKKRRFDSMESYFQEHISKLVKYFSEVEDCDDGGSPGPGNAGGGTGAEEGCGMEGILVSTDNPESILRYRLNYYNSKFKASISLETGDESGYGGRTEEANSRVDQVKGHLNEVSDQVCIHYLRGLSWVLRYYYHGVPSWDWYYPYHYAPYVIDIVEAITNVNNNFKVKESLVGGFELGKPFTQFEQLMSVLPPKSGKICLPTEFYNMMIDANNPLIEFYPSKFKQDPNGNKQRWKWVALLPFIDQKVLLENVKPLEDKMDALSKYRNRLGCDILYTYKFSPIKGILERSNNSASNDDQSSIKISDMPIFGFIKNYLRPDLDIQCHDLVQVTAPITETCQDAHQSKEIIGKMLNDGGNKTQWTSILKSSFNHPISHINYLIGYFTVEQLEKKLIWEDPDQLGFQMFKIGFGSRTLPNSRPYSNYLSESDLNDPERKFKGFKANLSQKILFKLFNIWNLNIDFTQHIRRPPPFSTTSHHPPPEYRDNKPYTNKRFRDTQYYNGGDHHYQPDHRNDHRGYYYSSSDRAPPPHHYNETNTLGDRLYDNYYSKNRERIFDNSHGNPNHYQNNNNHYNNYLASSDHTYPLSGNYYAHQHLPRNEQHFQDHNLQSGMRVKPRPDSYGSKNNSRDFEHHQSYSHHNTQLPPHHAKRSRWH
ncbi:Rat1 Kar1/Rat1 like 5'-3' exonuclease [Cryptosporidium canis]|nr:Rat1 Kar1/Rat1 like 5'-3' exonuclease [Cryptosporidium canis]